MKGENASFSHPLLQRLVVDLAWPRLTTLQELAGFTDRPGTHCLLVPGNPARNLETADAAVILPQLHLAFQGAFDCALVDDAIEAEVRKIFNALITPGFLFFRAGRHLGSIQKIRNWEDYLQQVRHLLALGSWEQLQ